MKGNLPILNSRELAMLESLEWEIDPVKMVGLWGFMDHFASHP
jgi:hypothetical protein